MPSSHSPYNSLIQHPLGYSKLSSTTKKNSLEDSYKLILSQYLAENLELALATFRTRSFWQFELRPWRLISGRGLKCCVRALRAYSSTPLPKILATPLGGGGVWKEEGKRGLRMKERETEREEGWKKREIRESNWFLHLQAKLEESLLCSTW